MIQKISLYDHRHSHEVSIEQIKTIHTNKGALEHMSLRLPRLLQTRWEKAARVL